MRKIIVLNIPLALLVSCLISSCLPETKAPDYNAILESSIATVNQTKLQEDIIVINDSLNKWVGTGVITGPILKDSKDVVRYTVQSLGTGPKPTLASYIVIKYKGNLLTNRTGTPFDQGDNLQIYLHQLIIGWQTTLPLLPQGTKATLYIPSGYAYGSREIRDNNGNITIPSNSILIFEIEILGVY